MSITTKIVVMLAFWAAYILPFKFLWAHASESVGALSIIPVAATAWFFGFRAGLVGAAVSLGLMLYLFSRVGAAPESWWSVALPAAALLFVATIVGYSRTLHDRLRKQGSEYLRRAERDSLTGLLTRRALMDRAEVLVGASNGPTAVLFVDLDGFKEVNDTRGHVAGDQVLREIARRLTDTLRTSDLIARLGGDEFVILAPHLERAENADTVARNVVAALRAPHTVAGTDVSIPASVGVSLYPTDARDVQQLLAHADTAMYRVKDEDGDGHHLYDAKLDRETTLKHQLLLDLRDALANEEFELLYQPQIELVSGRPTGFETLLRWNHPHLGQLSPAAFLPLAESNDLIGPIGAWVVRTACAEAHKWDREGCEPLTVSVNVSAAELAAPDFIATTRRALVESGLPPAQLELEITETPLLRDLQQALETLHALHDLGVRLAIDDFGAGYSSLEYLRMLPLNTLKIDRSYMVELMKQDPRADRSQAIVRGIAELAHNLGLRSVVEGVETEAELAWLESSGCDDAQGFLLARPMPASRIATWLDRYAGTRREAAPRDPDASSTQQDTSGPSWVAWRLRSHAACLSMACL